MKQQVKDRGRRLARSVAQRARGTGAGEGASQVPSRATPDKLDRQLAALRRRVNELEQEVQEQRLLNRRLAELADIVQELLIPAVDRDDERLAALLDDYASKL
ncbi:MAG: hypothetical protein M3P83_07990 [Actinomycetota bacterium]|nr:hypothetical protein [Actinomycetota bacterium]